MINKIALPISIILVTVLSFLLAYSCNNEKLNKASKNEMISFKVSTTSSSVPTHTTGTGSHVEVVETFQGSPGGQGGVVQVPVANVTLPENTKYEVDVPGRTYSVNTEVKVSGKEVTAKSEMKITVDNKEYILPVKTNISKVDVKPVSRWKLEPSLFLGVGSSFSLNDLGRVDVSPMIAASVLNFGSVGEPSSLAIGAVGVGYGLASREVQFILAPVLLNINPAVPFLKNTFISPTVSIDINKNVGVGVSLAVAL